MKCRPFQEEQLTKDRKSSLVYEVKTLEKNRPTKISILKIKKEKENLLS